MSSYHITQSLRVLMEGSCERLRSIIKRWENVYIRITNRDLMISETSSTTPKMSHTYLEILVIRKQNYGSSRKYCISLKTKKTTCWLSFSCEEELDKYYNCLYQAWKDHHSAFTQSLTAPAFLYSSSSNSISAADNVTELDPELSIIMCKLADCANLSDIKTFLLDIEAYQNGKPIEEVVLQKVYVASFFEEFKLKKEALLTPAIRSYIDNLLDGFNDTVIDNEPIDLSELEAKDIDINTIVELSDVLGHGKYGIVRKGILKSTGEKVAVKIIKRCDLSEHELMSLKRECRIMYELRNHPHIVSLKEFCGDTNYFYIVEELEEGGELFDAIISKASYSEREAQNVVRTLLYTLRYCHEKGVVHRDLKPENILLANKSDSLNIKLADFGFATHSDGLSNMKTICGTPGYSAPEIIRGEHYGPGVDMWSLGVITYILLCGYPPFPQNNDLTSLKLIVNGTYQFYEREWKDISDEAKDFVKALLVPDPNQRASARYACTLKWMQFESTRTMHMNAAVQQLSRFNARRKEQSLPCVDYSMDIEEVKDNLDFVSLTNCGVRDSPSLARSMNSVIPAQMRVPAKEVIYTIEGTWVLLDDRTNCSWLLVEKHGYDPMCVPSSVSIYKSVYPRGIAVHNIRSEASVDAPIVGKVPSGSLFLGIQEITNDEGVWIVMHRQTLHTYDIPSSSPCFLCAHHFPSDHYVDKLK